MNLSNWKKDWQCSKLLLHCLRNLCDKGEVEPKAIAFYQQSLELKEQIGDSRGKATTFAGSWQKPEEGRFAKPWIIYSNLWTFYSVARRGDSEATYCWGSGKARWGWLAVYAMWPSPLFQSIKKMNRPIFKEAFFRVWWIYPQGLRSTFNNRFWCQSKCLPSISLLNRATFWYTAVRYWVHLFVFFCSSELFCWYP